MKTDNLSAVDSVQAGISSVPTKLLHPCPLCSKRTKSRDDGQRGCLGCGHVYQLDSMAVIPLL